MACCAFAVLLLTQLLAPLRWVWRRLGLARDWQPESSVIWSPGAQPAMAVARPFGGRARRWGAIALACIALDAALIAGVAFVGGTTAAHAGAASVDQTVAETILHAATCGQFGGTHP